MVEPNANNVVSANGYRYGFNGQENENEIANEVGAITSAEFWAYDARLGRRWNRDPIVIAQLSVAYAFERKNLSSLKWAIETKSFLLLSV